MKLAVLLGGLPLWFAFSGHAAVAASAPTPNSLERFMNGAQASFSLQKSSSGLLFKILQPGAGPRPRVVDTVVLTLKATAPDGKSPLPILSGDRVRVTVSDLLPGLAEGVQMLTLGARAVLVVPPALSFANGAWPSGIGRDFPIIFEVTLDDVLPVLKTPPP